MSGGMAILPDGRAEVHYKQKTYVMAKIQIEGLLSGCTDRHAMTTFMLFGSADDAKEEAPSRFQGDVCSDAYDTLLDSRSV